MDFFCSFLYLLVLCFHHSFMAFTFQFFLAHCIFESTNFLFDMSCMTSWMTCLVWHVVASCMLPFHVKTLNLSFLFDKPKTCIHPPLTIILELCFFYFSLIPWKWKKKVQLTWHSYLKNMPPSYLNFSPRGCVCKHVVATSRALVTLTCVKRGSCGCLCFLGCCLAIIVDGFDSLGWGSRFLTEVWGCFFRFSSFIYKNSLSKHIIRFGKFKDKSFVIYIKENPCSNPKIDPRQPKFLNHSFIIIILFSLVLC